ncbi:methyltransferase domain-containing protein [Tenacibaculum maritimum]|uniref:methyltransferase domain-containing protein n=1 Tax=Tenacibaculum maritimum TaxID=107401 RepID=UPI003876170A
MKKIKESSTYIYSEGTYNSKNLLARFSHRSRFSVAIKLTLEKEFKSILDYGAGDNKFLKELDLKKGNLIMTAFEPIMENKPIENIEIITKLSDLKKSNFDVISCFETLEHFNESSQLEMLKIFFDKLRDNGRVIISVPIEIGFPSLIKNIRRKSSLKNSIKCFLGIGIPEIRNSEGYIFSHLGFQHKKLEKLISNYFHITKKVNSPFNKLPEQLNSQVFYILEKKC